MRRLDPKNAEVTKRAIKARGSPVKSNQTLVVGTPTGSLKKRLLYAGTTVLAGSVMVGLWTNWVPEFVHLAYLCGGLWLSQMLTLRFTKME